MFARRAFLVTFVTDRFKTVEPRRTKQKRAK